MRVLLVRPPRMKQSINLGEVMYSEPIGLEMVYTVLENDHEVEIFDMMAENKDLIEKIKDYAPDIVGLTSLCIDVEPVLSMAEKIKEYKEDIEIVAGGTQAFFSPESFYSSYIDHVMKFTTEQNLNALFKYIELKLKKENRLLESDAPMIDGVHSRVNGFKSTEVKGRNQYIKPNRKSTEKYRGEYSYFGYKPAAIMGTAQGCSKGCDFCLRWRLEGYSESYFDIDSVKNEIREIKEPTIMIFDNDFLHSKDRINQICDFLEEENINKNFICYASVKSILENKVEIERFVSLGLKAALVGYETFKEDDLKSYKKGSTTNDSIKCSMFTKEIGLDIWASFIFHPDWTKKDFKDFRRYIKILDPEISTFSPLTPFPGLPLYERYRERLLFPKEDYEKWSFGQVVIKPQNMSLRQYYIEILKTIIYVNTVRNNIFYITKKFGFLSLFRLAKGSFGLLGKYSKLILKSSS